MGPCVRSGAVALRPSIFVGDVESMNVGQYIYRCHIIDEYILNSSVPTNKLGYIHRLTDEFILYSSVLLLYSLVQTEK
jgi:hypothetical protein